MQILYRLTISQSIENRMINFIWITIMTLPVNGLISLSAINVELGKAANSPISLNDANVRSLLNKASGAIGLSDAYGKSLAPAGNTIVAGSGINTLLGNNIRGWNNTYPKWTPIPFGSANPTPMPMTPYGGTMHGLTFQEGYQIYVAMCTGISDAVIHISVNGNRFPLYLDGSSYGYNEYYAYDQSYPNYFFMDGRPSLITFG